MRCGVVCFKRGHSAWTHDMVREGNTSNISWLIFSRRTENSVYSGVAFMVQRRATNGHFWGQGAIVSAQEMEFLFSFSTVSGRLYERFLCVQWLKLRCWFAENSSE